VPIAQIRSLRRILGLSRSELSRFLGVSEATVVRWESDRTASEPKGLQAILLATLADAAASHPPAVVGRVVRSCGWDHRDALKTLLDWSESGTPAKGTADESRR
jgi:transcriptional regulator with XRE-family HTH domain